MSPSRTRKPVARLRPRRELIIAIAVSVGIVAATLLVIWLLRPGPRGSQGTGGLFARQPRATLLVVGTGVALGAGIWWMLRGRHRPRKLSPRVAVIVTVVVVLGGAVALGFLWPGGLVREYDQSFDEVPQPTTPTDTEPPASTPASTPGSTPAPSTPAPSTPAPSTPASGTPTSAGTPGTTGGP